MRRSCCKKRRYATKEAAERVIARIAETSDRGRIPQRAYQCAAGWWHLTGKAPRKTAEIPKKTRTLIYQRDGMRCFRCGRTLANGGYSIQHRRARGMGGTSDASVHSPANLILLCGSGTTECHGQVEGREADDNVNGYWLRAGQSPESTPVRHAWLGSVLLGEDGSITPYQPDGGTHG